MTSAQHIGPSLRLDYTRTDSTLKVSGELDMSNVQRLSDAFDAHLSETGITLDLTDLSFMDSAGLQEILGRALSLEGGAIKVRGATPMIRKLFKMTGVDRVPALSIEPEAEHVPELESA